MSIIWCIMRQDSQVKKDMKQIINKIQDDFYTNMQVHYWKNQQLIVYAFPQAQEKVKIPNTIDKSPKNVEIDCLVDNRTYEIKWKDATTDGDHIKKEHKWVQIIKSAGYIPVRIMFFEPNRNQAIHIQATLKKLYEDMGGEYYSGEDAWDYLMKETGVDLKVLFNKVRMII